MGTTSCCNKFSHCFQPCLLICKTCCELECHHPRCFQQYCFPTCYFCCPCFKSDDDPKSSEDPVPLIDPIDLKRYKIQVEKEMDNQAVRQIYFLTTLVTVFGGAVIGLYSFTELVIPHILPIYKYLFNSDVPLWYTCYELTDECVWDPGADHDHQKTCDVSWACVGTWHMISIFTLISQVGMAMYVVARWPYALYTGQHNLQTVLHLVTYILILIIITLYFEGAQVWQSTLRNAPGYQWGTLLFLIFLVFPGFLLGIILIYRLTIYLNRTWQWDEYNPPTEQDVVAMVKRAKGNGGSVRCRGSKHS